MSTERQMLQDMLRTIRISPIQAFKLKVAKEEKVKFSAKHPVTRELFRLSEKRKERLVLLLMDKLLQIFLIHNQ